MHVMNLEQIKKNLDMKRAIAMQEEGFRLYSAGKATVPPVGYMNMGEKFGEVHIKSGWLEDDDVFVIKVVGAYPQNPIKHGLPVIQGAMIAFNAHTGQPEAFLQDEGYLTNLRTALAGLIAAKYLAPEQVNAIGVLGTGIQARFQIELLKFHTACRNLYVWGRDRQKAAQYVQEMTEAGFKVSEAGSPDEIANKCNLILTTTAAHEPLLSAHAIQKGTHITAVGADAPGKQELDPEVFRIADLCVVDSKSQCLEHGEVSHAYRAGLIEESSLIELGAVIQTPRPRRIEDQITVADLTGVSVQDIQIVKTVLL